MDEEYLSDDELFSLWNQKFIDPYRVYFDKENGNIYSITNELSDNGYDNIEVEFKDVEHFLTGKSNIAFFRIEIDDEGAIKFVNKKESPVVFKSNIIEYIRAVDNNTAILQVEWHPTKWLFKVDQKFLKNPRSKNVNSKINFFITREDNINVLYRIIEIKIKDLIQAIEIPFITEEEKDIENIAMFTLPFFESYGMTIYEN